MLLRSPCLLVADSQSIDKPHPFPPVMNLVNPSLIFRDQIFHLLEGFLTIHPPWQYFYCSDEESVVCISSEELVDSHT